MRNVHSGRLTLQKRKKLAGKNQLFFQKVFNLLILTKKNFCFFKENEQETYSLITFFVYELLF